MTRACLLLALAAHCAWAAPDAAIEGIAHVAYRVSDLAQAEAFFSGMLALPRGAGADEGAVGYQVGGRQSLEIAAGAPALDHIAVETRDIAAARRALRAKAPRRDAAGNLTFTLQAPEGTRIDMLQYRAPRTPSPAGMFTHLQHTGVIVARDQVEASLAFYRDQLGCTEFWRYEPTPGDLRLIKLLLPGPRRDIIELMIHRTPLTPQNIASMHHINFAVPDIHAAHRFVMGRGAPASLRPRVNAEDIWAFNLSGPDGFRTEVQDITKIPPAAITEETFHGRHAWVLSNGWMRVSVLAGGGHIAEVRLLSDDAKRSVNPMRVPHYPTIEPYNYDDARDNAVYGDTPHRWLSAGYMGHLLCFPVYGPPSDDEARAGLGNHGEAPIVEWRKMRDEVNADGVTLWYGADLPKTEYRVERKVWLPRGLRLLRVEETVENLTRSDRPMNWMQHATFGPPFIEPGKTVLELSAKPGQKDVRLFPAEPHSGSYVALRTDPSREQQFFALSHPDFRVLIGYIFPTAENPWIADWRENRRSTVPPWNGEVVARGIEFGSSPYAEGLRKSVERGSLDGAPAFRWIGGRQKLHTEFTIFLQETAEGSAGLQDARLEHGVPVLTMR